MQVEAKASPSLQQLINKFNATPSETDAAVRKAVALVVNEFRAEVTGPKGLSKYPRHKGDQPSPPGEPPAQRTTALRKSLRIGDSERLGFAHYAKSVGPTVKYARAQELGYGRLPARPYMEPARKRLMRRARFIYLQEIGRVLGKYKNG